MHVPLDWRSAFLQGVVDLLEGVGGERNDASIAEAINRALERLHVNASCPSCVGDV